MSALSVFFRQLLQRPQAERPDAAAPAAPPSPLRLARADTRRRDTRPGGPLPVRDVTRDERDAARLHAQGLFLARQDRWEELDALVRETDAGRVATPGGASVAELLARGAGADAIEPGPDGTRAPGLAWLHDLLADLPDRPGVALAVALAEIATAEAARRDAAPCDLGVADRMDYFAHLAQAAQVLEAFDPVELDSPALAAARCALAPVWQADTGHIRDLYEDLIDLDPANPRHMRALGRALRPRGLAALAEIDCAARDTAARTQDIWGSGGYAWCWHDVLLADPRSFERLDTDRFLQGIEDILLRHEDQHLMNQLAACCTLAARAGFTHAGGRTRAPLFAAIEKRRAAVRAAGQRILRERLGEIHPCVWAETAGHAGGRPAAIEAGIAMATAALAEAHEARPQPCAV
jgi:hypothetical protein